MEVEEIEFIPRNYQIALFEKCLEGNTIIFLPTGTGKTFIAVMVLKKLGGDLLGEDHKVSIVLVNTVALVDQHVKYIKQHTPFLCGGYSGEMNVDYWKPDLWHKEFNKNQVLVMTCEILAVILRGNIVDLSKVNLLIFDECHHGVQDHSMRQLMINFQNLLEPPKVIGLTATLLNGNCKPFKVMDEVKALEVTFQSKVATVEGLEVVVGYATNPRETIIVFDEEEPGEVLKDCIERLDIVISKIKTLTFEETNVKRTTNSNLIALEPADGIRKVINIIKDVKIHLLMLGIHGGKVACLSHLIEIERIKKHTDVMKLIYTLNYIQTVLGLLMLKMDREMSECKTEKERFWRFSSNKVLKFIEVLNEFKNTSQENLCGLVFVERRFTAKVIFHILDDLSKSDPDYSYIRPDFVVGSKHNMSQTREGLYLSKKNRQVIDGFVNKEVNLLCTSQVLEEGIDIPKCTLVCKFDIPKDYRSYIQSKGRARHQKSQYYILVPNDSVQQFRNRYREFQDVEDTLNTFLIGKTDEREAPTSQEIEDMYNENLLPPYYVRGPGSAYISEVSAIPLLTRYCLSLPSDQYTVHCPEWYIDKSKCQDGLYVVTVLLPIICPLSDPIEGLPMKNKKMAKRACAYVACIKLYQCGEFTDTLLPIERNVPEEDVSYLFEHHPVVKEDGAGMKKIRYHDVKIPNAALGNLHPGIQVYLHIINFEPLFSKTTDDINTSTIHDMYTSSICYGLLTPNPMPSICNFPLYVSYGTLTISIVNNANAITVSEEEIKKIKEFHYTVFHDILNLLNSFLVIDNSENAESIFLVPVNKDEFNIDYDILESHRSVKTLEDTLSHAEKQVLQVDDESYLHKIVIPTYRKDVSTYLVTRVCYEQSPKAAFPNDAYKDFCEYYMEKHQQNIVNRNQPLLYVKGLSKNLNFYKPTGLLKKRKKEKMYDELPELLIPEMLVKQDFPASLWIQARCLPSILSRVSYLLRIRELWKNIANDCNFILADSNMKPLRLNLNLIKYEPNLEEDGQIHVVNHNYERSERVPALPSSLISNSFNRDFQAKVLESRYPWKDLDEPVDLNRSLDVTVMDVEAYENFVGHLVNESQRKDVHKSPVKNRYLALTYHKDFVHKSIKLLEMELTDGVELADLYEAMTTSKANDVVNLERLETLGDSFLKYIVTFYLTLRFPQYNEGKATALKGRLISNKNLFYLAKKHNIGGIMKNKSLMPKHEWLPPGFCVPERMRKGITEREISINSLFQCEFSRTQRITGEISDEEINRIIRDYPHSGDEDNYHQNMDHFFQLQCLRDKCVADVIEAILGVYLQKTGISGCLRVIQWIGVIPATENLEEFLKKPPVNPLLKEGSTLENILFHLPLCSEIEKIVGYTFANKGYLLQAFTHGSYTTNRVTQSYEKLEFLGDAILDFLITCFIYESCDDLTPGDLTDLRSALVNNNTFASYLVRLGLHKFLLMMNSKLQTHIDRFVDFLTMKNFEIDDEVLILLQEDDLNMADYVDVPKVLGDIFEALAGAIFLDSGYSLETVWRVFYKIMWGEIESFSRNIPKNMVRRLFESEGAYPEFGSAQPTNNGRVMVKLHFHAEGRPKYVYGFGSNKIMAKKAAAKIALQYL